MRKNQLKQVCANSSFHKKFKARRHKRSKSSVPQGELAEGSQLRPGRRRAPGPGDGAPRPGDAVCRCPAAVERAPFSGETKSADGAPRLHGPDGSEAPGPEVGASLRSVSGPSTSHTGVDVPSLGDRSWRAPLPTPERSFWASRYVGFPKNRNSLKLTFFAFFSRY